MLLGEVTSPSGRALKDWEIKLIDDVYQGAVDTARVRVVEAKVLNAPSVLGNQIRVPPGYRFDTPDPQQDHRAVLVHEMGHVWQYQTMGTAYMSDATLHNASGQIATGDRNVAYMNYTLKEGSRITDYAAEEQAQIISDYFEITRLNAEDSTTDWVVYRRRFLSIYETLIKQVRERRSKTEHEIYTRDLLGVPEPMRGVPERDFAPIMPLIRFRF